MPSLPRDSQYIWLVLLLSVAGAFARIYGLCIWGYSFDEMWHVYVAGQSTLVDIFYTDLRVDGHPLLPYLLWHWLLDINNTPCMARLPSLIAGIACIPLAYAAGKEMLGHKNGGLFAAFFVAFSPLMIEQSDVVRGYALMMCFMLVALWSVYRYRSHPLHGYILLYFLSSLGALFCEFSAVPLIAFTASHLLYSIYRQSPPRPLNYILWALLHLALLIYLLLFVDILNAVNAYNFSENIFFKPNDSMLTTAARMVIYFCNFINDNSVLLYGGMVTGIIAISLISFIMFWLATVTGIVWLVRSRQWPLLALVCIPTLITIVLDCLGKISMDTNRHMIGLIIPLMALIYSGCAYWFRNRQISPVPAIIAATLALTAGYAVYGTGWRYSRTDEFQLTHAQIQETFAFLDTHVGHDDAIITDWEGYYHFWQNNEHCKAKLISPQIALYPCYTAPVYILNEDMRTAVFMMTPIKFQKAMQQLNMLGLFKNTQKIWLMNVENMDSLLNTQFASRVLLRRFSAEQRAHHTVELNEIISEQEDFARFMYDTAEPRKIDYLYACADGEDAVTIGGTHDCQMSTSILALPKSVIVEKIIRRAPFHNPQGLLERVTQE